MQMLVLDFDMQLMQSLTLIALNDFKPRNRGPSVSKTTVNIFLVDAGNLASLVG
jgi:hypothetical protein